MRLGRCVEYPVEWSEINAGLGYSVLLLQVLSEKLDFSFRNYRLCPLGSFSKIEKINAVGEDEASYELYGYGDSHISRLFWNRRFDNALIAFLNCIQQIGEHSESVDSKFKLPYRINKDKIGEVSIKHHLNQDELWTKGIKIFVIIRSIKIYVD